MKLSARFFGFFLTIFLLLPISCYLLPAPAFAQSQGLTNSFMRVDNSVPLTISTVTQGIFLGMLSSTTCMLGGIDFFSPNHKCLGYDAKSGNLSYAKDNETGGILGLEVAGLTIAYTSPFHTSDYFDYLSQNFGLTKPAYAAGGIGFSQLNPIVNLWIAFRNLSYLFFVIVFVVIGFAIMLRAKIDPRTVMTIENQIPKLVVALILITFSFAIAGFIIDLMWVAIYLVINLFGGLDPQIGQQVSLLTSRVRSDPFTWVSALSSSYNGFGPITAFKFVGFLGLAGQASGAVYGIAQQIGQDFFANIGIFKYLFVSITSLPTFLACALGTALHINYDTPVFGGIARFFTGGQANSVDFGACIDAGLGSIVAGVMTAVVFIIFSICLIVAIARLWWALIKAYALFLIFTIFGPIIIMLGVVPGSKTNFEYWIRHLLALTIVFPTAMSIFLLGKTLMDVYQPVSVAAPPLLGIDPKISAFLGPLLGFVVIMLAPQTLSLVEEALGAPEPKFLAGLGQAIGAGAQPLSLAGGNVFKRWTREADMFHEEGALRKAFLGQQSATNWWRRFWVGGERNGFNSKPS